MCVKDVVHIFKETGLEETKKANVYILYVYLIHINKYYEKLIMVCFECI